jgi:hypothetical protein
MTLRKSPYIDFETGNVITPPMVLSQAKPRPLTDVDDMIEIFECRVDVWQLGVAVAILRQIECHDPAGHSIWAHSAYGIISVLFNYFEMIGKTLNPASQPRGSAGVDFNCGFCDVYPSFAPAQGQDFSDSSIPDVVAFRDRVRNGIYHLGYTKGNLFLWNEPSQPDFLVDKTSVDYKYYVNPHGATRTVVAHFPGLLRRIRASEALRNRFERFFRDFHGLK